MDLKNECNFYISLTRSFPFYKLFFTSPMTDLIFKENCTQSFVINYEYTEI